MVMVPPVDDQVCLQVGKLIIRWSFLDKRFCDMIDHMANVSKTQLKNNWRKRLRVEQRYDLFQEQAKLCFGAFPKIEAELNDFRIQMEAIQLHRDMFAHGQISMLYPIGLLSIRLKRKKQEVHSDYTLGAIQSVVAEITNLMGKLEGLTEVNALDQSVWSAQELSALRDFLAASR